MPWLEPSQKAVTQVRIQLAVPVGIYFCLDSAILEADNPSLLAPSEYGHSVAEGCVWAAAIRSIGGCHGHGKSGSYTGDALFSFLGTSFSRKVVE